MLMITRINCNTLKKFMLNRILRLLFHLLFANKNVSIRKKKKECYRAFIKLK